MAVIKPNYCAVALIMQWHSFVQLLWGPQKELNYKSRHSWKESKKSPWFQFLMHVITAFIAGNVQCWLWFCNKFNMQVLNIFYPGMKLVEIFLLKTWVNLVFMIMAVTLSASWTEIAVMKPQHQTHQTTDFFPLLMHTEICHHQSLNEGHCSERAHPGVKHWHRQKQRTDQGLHAWVWITAGIQRLKPGRPRQKMRMNIEWTKSSSKSNHPHKKCYRWRRPTERCLEESTVSVFFFLLVSIKVELYSDV